MNLSRQEPVVFPFGAEMLEWIRAGGRPDRAGTATRLAICWQAFWFERQLWLQRCLPPASVPRPDPLFIVGLWRSGTTFTHELLGSLPGMMTPATWQCVNASALRLRRPPSAGKSVVRPMDAFSIGALSPQEDEFALLALGAPSVYRGFFDPRRLAELADWLDEASWTGEAFAVWLAKWREFCANVSAGRSGRLLLKSPAHTFRIQALAHAMPAAAFVWLTREPAELFFSNRKMWLSMFRQYALWNWSTHELDVFLLRAMDSAAQCLEGATRALPPDRLVIVDFHRLIEAPVDVIDAIMSRLGMVDATSTRSAIESKAASASYPSDVYQSEDLPSASESVFERFRSSTRAAAVSHGLR
jgi:omega-hydroxy-beta-dihydromenaquinone-9 sulfotransferase